MKFTSIITVLPFIFSMSVQAKDEVEQADEMAQSYVVSGTVSLVSEYMSRGFHINWNKPALQGSLDFVHNNGWYASLWGSQVDDNFYANGSVEIDVLAGLRENLNEKLSYDIGIGAYFYPSANWGRVKPSPWPAGRYDTVEATFGISYDWLNIKYSHTLTDYYGYDSRTVPVMVYNSGVLGGVKSGENTRGSGYLEVNANVDIGEGLTLGLHAAKQSVANSKQLDYSDYRAGLTKSLPKGWAASLNYTTTHGAEIYNNFPSAKNNGKTMDIGGSIWVLGISKSI